jgi:hypothetical protein
MSICSIRDGIDKKEGRRIAIARARKAWGTQKDSDGINLNIPDVLNIIADLDLTKTGTKIFRCKSEFQPELIEYEKKLVDYI